MSRFEPKACRPRFRPAPVLPAQTGGEDLSTLSRATGRAPPRGLRTAAAPVTRGNPASAGATPVHRLLLLVLALSGCAMVSPRQAPAAFPVLDPATLGTTRSARQLLHGAFGEHDVTFQCVVEVGPEGLTLVGLSALGQRWFSLHHDGRALESEVSPQAPAALDPRRVLADLQLALWPAAALQQALSGSDWEVTEPAPATRRLRRRGRLVAEVHYAQADPWRGRLWLSNFATGYTLSVESGPLP